VPVIFLSKKHPLLKAFLITLTVLFTCQAQASTDTLGVYQVNLNNTYDTLLQPSGNNVVIKQFENVVYREGLPFYRILLAKSIEQAQVFNPFYKLIDQSITDISFFDKYYLPELITNKSSQSTLIDVPVIKYDSLLEQWFMLEKFQLLATTHKQQLLTNARRNTEVNSVLANGKWIKLAITNSGIYKIDYQYLQSAGFNPDEIDPRNLKIYGNGGKMLPQPNDKSRPFGLTENAIVCVGEQDGVFNAEDYLLFYGQSSDLLTYDVDNATWLWQNNDYSDTTYYFLTQGNSAGLRIGTAENVQQSGNTYNYYDDVYVHEKDIYNLLEEDIVTNAGSGREWLGEMFNSIDQDLILKLPLNNLIDTSPIEIKTSMVTNTTGEASVDVKLNGSSMGNMELQAIPAGRYSVKGIKTEATFVSQESPPGDVEVQITYSNSNGSTGKLYLDHLMVTCQRNLIYQGDPFQFRVIKSLENIDATYQITASQTPQVWDVTQPERPQMVSLTVNNNNQYLFTTSATQLKEFIAFTGNDYLTPVNFEEVANQNLKADLSPEMVIITHPLFKNAANQLAAFRMTHDQMVVKVVTTDEVYNEFANGSPDITAFRDYMKYLYENGQIKYLLLIGKCSFDFKNILEKGATAVPPNFVPTYQSRNSFHPIFSYSSDDYFGFLDENEGEWPESSGGDHLLDIGVGRLPATSAEEAETMVNKIIEYSSSKNTYGNWRKKIHFVADDEDFNTHQKDADILAEYLSDNYTDLDLNKIYLDAYPQQTTAFGERSPAVNQAIQEAIDHGGLIVNFTGHGSEIQWTDEKVIDNIVIEQLDNVLQLPLFVTATCEFGRHDHPLIRSGAEQLLINKRGGAIGLVTTARPVYSNTNFQLNRAFYEVAFEPINGKMPRLGDIFKYTKNNSLSGSVNRNFSLLGDPSMKLAYPENKIIVDEVRSLSDDADTLRALDIIQVQGSVTNISGEINPQFNGVVYASVFDKARTVTTFGNKSPRMEFLKRDNLLFQGKASVKDGLFNMTFPVPKNINYQFGKGKISLYAYKNDFSEDASGFANKIVGGSIAAPVLDNDPPEIELYLNDTLFKSGDLSGPNPILLARVSDESGISISTSGIGQDLKAQINQDRSFILNKFFTAALDSYQYGWVEYKLSDIPEGEHRLTLKAWDIYNNAASKSIDFWVGPLNDLLLSELKNFPNPFSESTMVTVGHNKSGSPLQVQVKVFNSQGGIVFDNQFEYNEATSRINLEWQGNDANGNKLPNGIYILHMSVRCVEDGASNAAITKLLIIN